jgi:hypothetical protein
MNDMWYIMFMTFVISCCIAVLALTPTINTDPTKILNENLLYGKSNMGRCFYWVRDNMRSTLTEIECSTMENSNDKK